MRVFVTGGTGFIGREIVRQLQSRGHEPVCLIRGSPPTGTASAAGGRYVAGNLFDPTSLARLMTGCGAAIHLVGIIAETRCSSFETAHVRATQSLLDAARISNVSRLVHMSALGSRPNAVSRYHQTKWRAEELVRSSGLDFTIFRPSIVYGPEDQFVNKFAAFARRLPFMPILGSGRGTFQPVPVEAVGQAFAGALEMPNTMGKTYDLAGRETLTLVEIADEIARACGRRRRNIFLPNWAARPLAAAFEAVFGSVLNRPPPFNRDQLAMLEEKTAGQFEPAARRFGLNPPSFREGIARWLTPG
jgi:NADH dehydrogenase